MFTRGLSRGINGDTGSDAHSSSPYPRQLRKPMRNLCALDFGMDGYFLLNRESDRPYSSRMQALKKEWSRCEIVKQRKKGKKLYFGVMVATLR